MEENLRVGVVGTSWWSEEFHLAGLASHPRAEVVAICGRDRARTEQVAARHGGPQVFTDHRAMFASGLLDAAVVATPDDSHREVVLAAVESGLHLLCEKPLARTSADAKQMLEAAEAAGRVHMVMFTWRWIAIFTHLRDLVAAGYLGHCRDARYVMQAEYADERAYGWRFDPARGSGIVGDLGSHMIDLARWYLGEIVQVSAQLATHVTRPGADGEAASSLDDSATLIVQFAGGACGTIDVSGVRLVGALPNQRVALYGDQGSLEADVEDGHARLRGRRRSDESWQDLPIPAELSGLDGDHPIILDLPLLAPLTNLPVGDRLFVDAALGRRPASPTFEDAWHTQRVVDAATLAHRERRWVPVT